jgi:hypothetical protein
MRFSPFDERPGGEFSGSWRKTLGCRQIARAPRPRRGDRDLEFLDYLDERKDENRRENERYE